MSNKPFKLILNEEIHLVDEPIYSYESLINKAAKIFEINQVLHKINIFYLDNDILCEVLDTKTFLEILNSEKSEKPKLKVFLEAINVDDMLRDMEPCKSMMVNPGEYEKKRPSNHSELENQPDKENQEKDNDNEKASDTNEKILIDSPFEKKNSKEAKEVKNIEKEVVTSDFHNSIGQFSLLRYSGEPDFKTEESSKSEPGGKMKVIAESIGNKKGELNIEAKNDSVIKCDDLVENFKQKQHKIELSTFLYNTYKESIEKSSKEFRSKFPFISNKIMNEMDTTIKAQFEEFKLTLEKKLELTKSDKEKKEEQNKVKYEKIYVEQFPNLLKEKAENVQIIDDDDDDDVNKKSNSDDKIETYSKVDLEDIHSTKKEIIEFNTRCNFCKASIIQFKFVCLICSDVILCEMCEYSHDHPTLKFKSNGISSKLDAVYMLSLVDKLDHIKKDEGVFKRFKNSIFGTDINKAQLFIDYQKLETVRARPNKKFLIPVSVANHSKNVFPADTNIVVRNFFDLKHKSIELNVPLGGKEIMIIDLEFEGTHPDVYELELFLYHADIKFEQDILKVKVEINNDSEEEALDEFLKQYPKLRFIPKNEKMILYNIKREQISDKDSMLIYCIMMKYGWSIDHAIDELTS